jgi:hypothetical protein
VQQIAYLCGATTVSWSTSRRADAYEHDLAFRQFKRAFSLAGRLLVEVLWSDTSVDWNRFEAAIIGSAWDYTRSPHAFFSQISAISSRTKLLNGLEVVRWNMEKTYLRELEAQGVIIIPTIWESKLGEKVSDDDFDALLTDRIIIKPTVGACSEGQILVDRGKKQFLDLQIGASVMLQKFYPSISEHGEKSFVFFGNEFSHSVLKTPASGDYRVQSIFEGTERVYTPKESELRICENIIRRIPAPALYARIDLVDLPTGELALMECELIEPYLYPTYAPDDSRMFVRKYLSL